MIDEGGPFGFGDQELITSHRKLLWSKAMVVSVAEKSGRVFTGSQQGVDVDQRPTGGMVPDEPTEVPLPMAL